MASNASGALADIEQWLRVAVGALNGLLWNQLLVYLLLGAGAWFTLRFGLIQLRALPESLRALSRSGQGTGVTAFQAFATGLASRVGTGNIAGVAVALSTGGPGAIFWMWMTALLGMATGFVEATLAQVFKRRQPDGSFRGGPAYYIETGLGSRWLGIAFAVALILTFGLAFNAVQANSISEAFGTAFGLAPAVTGAALVALAAPILFGGIARVGRVAQIVVPLMALLYLGLALFIVAMHASALPAILARIVTDAFGLGQAAGGIGGYAVAQAMQMGIKRGLFSNEAGMGSAPNAAASASGAHPVNQGLLQMLGVAIDTLLICSTTALMILASGQFVPGGPVEGAALTQRAVTSQIGGAGAAVMAVLIFLFAFSSIIGNYAYAESNIGFLSRRASRLFAFRILVLVTVMFGSVGSLPLVWDMADVAMGAMALINLVAIILLAPYARAVWRDYQRQRRAGIDDPVFRRTSILGLEARIPPDVWVAADDVAKD